MTQYLYRGANPDLHRKTGGKLRPRCEGEDFKDHAYWGQFYWGDGSVFGKSATNKVISHQRDSSKHPSSGISTTPIYENAVRYATHNGKYKSGYVYKIDASLLAMHGVTAYHVDQHAVKPQIPADKEVILLARDFRELPDSIIVEVIEV